MSFTIWLTGISGAGKSTLATALAETLSTRGLNVEVLDGDGVRTLIGGTLGFDRQSRIANTLSLGLAARLLNRHGVVAIVAAISPYAEARQRARGMISRFVEVHCDCPPELAAEKDVKGLYARAGRGEIAQFTAVSDPYEAPEAPEARTYAHRETVQDSLERVLSALRGQGLLPGARTEAPPADRTGPASKPPVVCIFNHIPKCGGTTLTKFLMRGFANSHMVRHEGDTVRVLTELNQNPPVEDTLIAGHFVWGMHEGLRFAHALRRITMLREPFSLFKSYYAYHHKRYNTPMPVGEYLLLHYEVNPLCQHLGGGDLDLAKRRLKHEYTAFGVMERYEASVALFAKTLSIPMYAFDVANASNSKVLELPEAVEGYFRMRNRDDLELYRWALEEFEERTRDLRGAKPASGAEPAPRPARKVQKVSYNAALSELIALGQYERAVRVLSQSGLEDSLDGLTVLDLYHKAGDLDRYIETARRLRKANRISETHFALAWFNVDKETGLRLMQAECERVRRHRTEMHDSSVNRYLATCLCLLAEMSESYLHQDETARKLHREAMAVAPPSPRALTSYAQFLIQRGEHRQALGLLQNLTAQNANFTWLNTKMNMLAQCRTALDQPGKGVSAA